MLTCGLRELSTGDIAPHAVSLCPRCRAPGAWQVRKLHSWKIDWNEPSVDGGGGGELFGVWVKRRVIVESFSGGCVCVCMCVPMYASDSFSSINLILWF